MQPDFYGLEVSRLMKLMYTVLYYTCGEQPVATCRCWKTFFLSVYDRFFFIGLLESTQCPDNNSKKNFSISIFLPRVLTV